MAFENLFIRTEKSIGGITLDAMLRESHSNRIRLSSNPVELGADITDNAVIEPKRVSVLARVSDTPLGVAALGQIVDLVTGLFGTSTEQNITRSTAAYNALVLLMDRREPIQIQTRLKLYQNMVIVSIDTTQDKDTSRLVALNINFQEVLIVDSVIVALNSAQLKGEITKEQATSAERKGREETIDTDPSTSRSVLKTVTGWIGGE